jgi:hypothetical protein
MSVKFLAPATGLCWTWKDNKVIRVCVYRIVKLCHCISVNFVMSVCADIKKIKRRLYQQKRRQSQGKEPAGSGGTPKKQRVRKVSVSIAVIRCFIFLSGHLSLTLVVSV